MAATVSSRVTVLGGGISGLTAAYYLSKRHTDPAKITVVEASPRLGGWMHSIRTDDGAIYEQGPRSMRPAGPAGWASLKLASELDLEKQIIPISSSHPGAQNRFIYSKGKIHKLPNSIASILKKPSLFSKSLVPVILKEPFIRKKTSEEDEAVYDFFCRRLNKEMAEYIVDPMCRGIFAGDARLLSLKSALPPVYQMENTHGSVVKAAIMPGGPANEDPHHLVQRSIKEKWNIWSLQGGLQTLAHTIHESLIQMGVSTVTDTPATSIQFQDDGSVMLHTGKEKFVSDHLISSLSADRLSLLIPDSHAVLKQTLDEIRSVSVGLVNLEYKGDVIANEGFGVLVPSSEPVNILGVLYDSCVFPQHDRDKGDHTRLTVMMGGHWFDEQFGHPDTVKPDTLRDTAIEGVGKMLGIHQDPVNSLTSVHRNCISQYHVGHADRVHNIFSYVEKSNLPISLIGASFKGVSVNDCIYNAKLTAEQLPQY